MARLYELYYGYSLDTEALKKYVWAYIPHLFNSPFYVYQYATCFSASFKIYNDVKNNVPGAKEAYLNMLKAGGSDYPVEIVKKGGADLTTAAPFKAVCDKLNELVDELEKLTK
jgi:oligoendopeptidase F